MKVTRLSVAATLTMLASCGGGARRKAAPGVMTLAVLLAACGILSPEETLVVSGTVYVDNKVAVGRAVRLYRPYGFLNPGEERLGSDVTSDDGTYRIEASIDDPDCDHILLVRVEGFEDWPRGISQCGPHQGIDLRLDTQANCPQPRGGSVACWET